MKNLYLGYRYYTCSKRKYKGKKACGGTTELLRHERYPGRTALPSRPHASRTVRTAREICRTVKKDRGNGVLHDLEWGELFLDGIGVIGEKESCEVGVASTKKASLLLAERVDTPLSGRDHNRGASPCQHQSGGFRN